MKTSLKQISFTYLIFIICVISFTSCGQSGAPAESDKSTSQHRKIKNGAQYAEDINNGKIKKDDFIGSPLRTASATVAGCHIQIRYSSPGVKGRGIWGKLVPYDKIWVTGANHATSVTFDRDVWIANQKLPAGTYAIFTIPARKDWVLIFNRDADQHLTDDYSKKDDMLRFTVQPKQLPAMVPRLTYQITPKKDTSAEISMLWEKRSISFSINPHQSK